MQLYFFVKVQKEILRRWFGLALLGFFFLFCLISAFGFIIQVLVVITDGKQTGGDATPVRNAANDLRRKGVHIVVVRIQNCRHRSCKVQVDFHSYLELVLNMSDITVKATYLT